MQKTPHRLALITAVSFAAASSAHAVLIADFVGGAGTAAPDQYAGIAGNGWTAAWRNSTNGSTNLATAVANTNPINGGGNYLTVNPNGNSDQFFGRAFDGTGSSGGVDATGTVTYSFDLRIDSLAGFGDSSNDQFSFHVTNGSNTSNDYNVTNTSSFIIRAYGVTTGTAQAGKWAFYNGLGDAGGFNANNFVDSGMTLTANAIYHFTITSNAATEKYDISVSDGTTTVSQTNLGWRTDKNFNAGGGNTLQNILAFGGREGTAAEDFAYSIDNISITAVPEPTTALLGSLGLIGLLRRRRA